VDRTKQDIQPAQVAGAAATGVLENGLTGSGSRNASSAYANAQVS
jgi:hypothetical protein